MKINQRFSAITIISLLLMLFLTSCSSEYKKNDKYTYGVLDGQGISSIYQLSEKPTSMAIADFSDGVSHGQKDSYLIYIAETKCGGVVAYGKGKYVYSPNKEDKASVKNALIADCMKNSNNDK